MTNRCHSSVLYVYTYASYVRKSAITPHHHYQRESTLLTNDLISCGTTWSYNTGRWIVLCITRGDRYKNVVTFGMCVCVCNQRIIYVIAHSFQSLGRHKFSGSSLLYTEEGRQSRYTHTRNVVLMKNKNFINQCHFIMRAYEENGERVRERQRSNTLSKRGSLFHIRTRFPIQSSPRR